MRLVPAALLVCFACTAPETSADRADALLFAGGTILPLSGAGEDLAQAHESMVVANGRILAVGSLASLRARYPDATERDLEGRTVLPGFVDSHAHVHEFGHDQRKADLTETTTVAEMVERLRLHAPHPDPGAWIVGAGWDEGVWGSLGWPDRALLDEAFPDNPVVLESLHGFAGFCNGAALERAGITAATPHPEGGTIVHREDGTPSGVLLTLAQALVNELVPEETPEETEASILLGLRTLARAGVTSVHEAGLGPARLAAYQRLAAQGRLPIRVYAMLDGNDEDLMESWFTAGPLVDPAGFLTVRCIKVFYDGSLGSRTALLREPYADEPHAARPTERIGTEAMQALAERAAQRGFQVAVHAIGDEGNDRTLSLFERVLARHPALDHRWRVEHAQVVLPDFYARAARLGLIASMQPSHAVGDSKWAEARLGPERILHAYAWRRMRDAGLAVAFNSDLPGEPWTPLETLYFAVTRQTLDGTPPGGWYAEQSFSVLEALSAMTRAGAEAAFQEELLGSLAPGMAADFVELDRNPLEVEPAELLHLTVHRTWVAGVSVR